MSEETKTQLEILDAKISKLSEISKLMDAVNKCENHNRVQDGEIRVVKKDVEFMKQKVERLEMNQDKILEKVNNIDTMVDGIDTKVERNHNAAKKAFLDFRSKHLIFIICAFLTILLAIGGMVASNIKSNNDLSQKHEEVTKDASKVYIQAMKKEIDCLIRERAIDSIKQNQ